MQKVRLGYGPVWGGEYEAGHPVISAGAQLALVPSVAFVFGLGPQLGFAAQEWVSFCLLKDSSRDTSGCLLGDPQTSQGGSENRHHSVHQN